MKQSITHSTFSANDVSEKEYQALVIKKKNQERKISRNRPITAKPTPRPVSQYHRKTILLNNTSDHVTSSSPVGSQVRFKEEEINLNNSPQTKIVKERKLHKILKNNSQATDNYEFVSKEGDQIRKKKFAETLYSSPKYVQTLKRGINQHKQEQRQLYVD